MPVINHNNPELSIYRMVRNRLPFVVDNAENMAVLSGFTLELMNQLNYLFEIPADMIGKEENYTVLMQSILADIICVYILMAQAAVTFKDLGAGAGTGGTAGSVDTFLKVAKAGSVEVQYDQADINKTVTKSGEGGGGSLGLTAMIDMYKASAIAKAYSHDWRLVLFEEDIPTVLVMDAPFKIIEY